jgi:hypothetical protein
MSHEASPSAMPTEKLRDMKCPKCGDNAKDCDDLVLAARCHPHGGVEVASHGNAIGIKCFVCGRMVVELAAPESLDISKVPIAENCPTCDCGWKINVAQSRCHPDTPMEVLYRKGRHTLDIRCSCKEIIGTIPLTTLN